jgi:hypothetical protein
MPSASPHSDRFSEFTVRARVVVAKLREHSWLHGNGQALIEALELERDLEQMNGFVRRGRLRQRHCQRH